MLPTILENIFELACSTTTLLKLLNLSNLINAKVENNTFYYIIIHKDFKNYELLNHHRIIIIREKEISCGVFNISIKYNS